MVNFNANFPEVLGNEWLMTRDLKSRVWSGSPAQMLRLPSTVAETIASLKMSAAVNPLLRASVPTLIDVIPEGAEFTALPKVARLTPNSDNTNTGWVDDAGSSSNIFNAINETTTQWPGSVPDPTYIRTTGGIIDYVAGVDASLFNGGAAANGRIFWVGVGAILGANTGFRKLEVRLQIDGAFYSPAGGSRRDVHGFGAIYEFFWGEINPATLRPWTPSEIAQFDVQSDWGIHVRSVNATPTLFPKVIALSLNVAYQNTENRVAVGVWRRPEDIGEERLIEVTTDTLRAMPAGTANWSKPSSGNFLYYWRQSASPSQYGPVVADDVRWNSVAQDLGPDGQPPGVVYPLHSSGVAPPPAGVIASDLIAYDVYGRPQARFTGARRESGALVLVRADAANSVDSQPYRLDLADLVTFRSTSGITGQRFTPGSSQTYIGVRLPVTFPTNPTLVSTLTVTVHRVSDGVQMGGSFAITATNVLLIKPGPGGIRYVTGFFSSGAALVGGTQYEVRLTTTGVTDWIVFAPNASLGASVSFGGTANGAMIAGAHVTTRDMSVNLIREPNPPTGLVAALTNVAVTTPYVADQVPTRQAVSVTWSPPGAGMGGLFHRYELERTADAGASYQRVANLYQAAANSFPDREAPRDTVVAYRIRAVGTDGRVSSWATSGSVMPTQNGMLLVLTSNHSTGLEVCYFYDKESSYLVLSDEQDETLLIHGADRSVVFMEVEDRGVGWQVNIWINQVTLTGRGGEHVLTPLLNLIRSLDVPYVCVLDNQGTALLGHVSVAEVPQRQPAHRYTAQITVTPTHVEPVPVEVL